MPFPAPFGRSDHALSESKALPAAASGSVVTDPIDLMHQRQFLADMELVVVAPALNTTQLPDTRTVTYSIETDDNAAFSSAKVLNASIGVQTGADAAGAAKTEFRLRVPSNVERYVRAKATTGASTGNCSAASMVLEPRF